MSVFRLLESLEIFIEMTEVTERSLNNELLDSRTVAAKIQEKEEVKAVLARKLHRLPKNAFGFITPATAKKVDSEDSVGADSGSTLPSYSGKVNFRN